MKKENRFGEVYGISANKARELLNEPRGFSLEEIAEETVEAREEEDWALETEYPVSGPQATREDSTMYGQQGTLTDLMDRMRIYERMLAGYIDRDLDSRNRGYAKPVCGICGDPNCTSPNRI